MYTECVRCEIWTYVCSAEIEVISKTYKGAVHSSELFKYWDDKRSPLIYKFIDFNRVGPSDRAV